MPKIVLKNRSKNIEYETKSQETINDIKKVIRLILNKEEADIKIVYNGKIVNDNVLLCYFRDGDIFDYVVKTDEIEMKNMENSVCIKIRNEKRYVDPNMLVTKNKKTYLVMRREKRKSLREEMSAVLGSLRFDVIVKIAMIVAFFLSDNKELAYLFGGLMIMKLINGMKFKLRMDGQGRELFGKVVVSFFISLFMLNSDEILEFK